MKLLVVGCSHSAGSEILEPWHPGCPERAYGGYLKELLGFTEYVNLSGPGYSNQWIYHKTVEWLESVNDPTEWFVIIGWTNAARLPVYCPEREKIVHLCPNHRDLKAFSKTIQYAYNHLYATMFPILDAIQLEHTRIIGMQMILKQMKIPYLFFDAVWPNHDQSSNKLIDLNRYYEYNNKDKSFWHYYQTNIWDGDTRWANHAPESWHKEWAFELAQYINERGLLSP